MDLIVKTLNGAEELLAAELKNLGATNVKALRRAVNCNGDLKTMYRICYESRFALRVLVNAIDVKANTDVDLYNAVHGFHWHEYITPESTIFIDHISFSTTFKDSLFLAQKTKDAIVDEIREHTGARPSVNAKDFDILLNVHATDDGISVALDASNLSLNRRGYRHDQPVNATNEVLAAALVEISGWTPDKTLYDPMCGAGTILIEAAMKARHIPANKYRTEKFGFENWKNFDAVLFDQIKSEADSQIDNTVRLNLIGTDTGLLDYAKEAQLTLGIGADMKLYNKSFKVFERQTAEGMIITCPPDDFRPREPKKDKDDRKDGRRGNKQNESPTIKPKKLTEKELNERAEKFYKEAMGYMAQIYPDYDVWVFSTNLNAMKKVQFHAEQIIKLFNTNAEGTFQLFPF